MIVAEQKFTWVGHGWKPNVRRDLDPGDGVLVAHDTMEHDDLEDPTLASEVEAHGAILYVRWDALPDNTHKAVMLHALAQGLGVYCAQTYIQSTLHLLGPSPTCCSLEYLDCEDKIADIVIDKIHQYLGGVESKIKAFSNINPRFRENLIGWLRWGYEQAHYRFDDETPQSLADIFKLIQDTVDNYEGMEVGDELLVQVNKQAKPNITVTRTKVLL